MPAFIAIRKSWRKSDEKEFHVLYTIFYIYIICYACFEWNTCFSFDISRFEGYEKFVNEWKGKSDMVSLRIQTLFNIWLRYWYNTENMQINKLHYGPFKVGYNRCVDNHMKLKYALYSMHANHFQYENISLYKIILTFYKLNIFSLGWSLEMVLYGFCGRCFEEEDFSVKHLIRSCVYQHHKVFVKCFPYSTSWIMCV